MSLAEGRPGSIYGIGTDLTTVDRFRHLIERHGERGVKRLLAPAETPAYVAATDPARFLAKRFAAKEALGKALGTGIRAPVLLTAIEICHDALGKPGFTFHGPLAEHLAQRQLRCHLSLSDEGEQVLAFVICEISGDSHD